MPRIALVFDNTLRPETTGFYVRRALAQFTDVEHFLPSELDQLARGHHGAFDLYLAIDDGLPYDIPKALCPLAFWAIDTHVSFDQVLAKAGGSQHVFAAQRDGAARLREAGMDSPLWLPLACDPEIHKPHPVSKDHDVAFIGHVFPGPREDLLKAIQQRFPRTFVGRHYLHDMARVYSASRVIFNRSIGGDINMRVFEALASGSLLVTDDLTGNGLQELFESGKHLITYRDEPELLARIAWALEHDIECERIASAGRRAVLAHHTYRHRVETMLQTIDSRRRTSVAVRATESKSKDHGYFEFARPEVLALIPESARSVLDLGCGAGRLGASVKARQEATVVGVELEPSAAAVARTRLDEVIETSAEAESLDFDHGRFDCVVCADVLEHLRHPERLLRKIGRWLTPAGTLVASIPNVRHHSVVRSLLAGNFTYESAGLLDETHLRFFTRREIEKLLFRAGFQIERTESVAGPGDEAVAKAAQTGEVRAGSLRITGLDPAEAAEFHAYQYLVTASPRLRKPAAPRVSPDNQDAAWSSLAAEFPWPPAAPDVRLPDHHVGWVGDGAAKALESALRRDARCVVALGSWLGESARRIAQLAPETRIVCIDHWQGSPEHHRKPDYRALLPQLYDAFQNRCWELRDRLIPLRMTTLEGLQRVADSGLVPDVLYLDAEHSTAAVRAEIELARRLFPSARLIGDDYSDPDVAAAVDEHARQTHATVVVHGSNWRAWELVPADETAAIADQDGLTSIILATHNQLDYTRLCLDSIRFRTDEPYELIVVDNGSTDGTVEFLRTCGDVTLIENAENCGFPAAVNQGLAVAWGEQILLLNNDTVVTTGWLRRMLDALRSDRKIGLVGPVSNSVSGTQQIPVPYQQLAELDGFAWDHGQRHARHVTDVDRLVGFCLLIDRKVIADVGRLDERFGIGNFEDDDYCRRAIAAGFRCIIAEDSFVHHFGGTTFRASGVDYARLLSENEAKYRDKWHEPEAFADQTSNKPTDATERQTAPSRVASASEADGPGEAGTTPPAGLPGSGPRLSLCMIVRDNERTIVPCLESIRPWVDEMIVVDTGSTDRTPGLCRELGAKVFHFPWCDDFSAARNESLKNAGGEWIFWMDSDDTIPEACGRQLRALAVGPHQNDVLGYVMQVHCPGPASDGPPEVTVVDHIKLFLNRPDLRFEHRIHEQILPAIRRAGGEVEFTDIHVIHSGSDHTPEGRERKLERDFRLLDLDLKERPGHPFVLFNIGMTHADAGHHDVAIRALRDCLRVSLPQESHVRKTYALLVSSLTRNGCGEEAADACRKGLDLFPEDHELLFRQALLLHEGRQLHEAKMVYRRLLTLSQGGSRVFSSRDADLTGWKARHNLALVCEDLGEFSEAERLWSDVRAERPGDLMVRNALDRLRRRIPMTSDSRDSPSASATVSRAKGPLPPADVHLDGVCQSAS